MSELLRLADDVDPLMAARDPDSLESLRIEVANERLAPQGGVLPVLDRRCADTGIDFVEADTTQTGRFCEAMVSELAVERRTASRGGRTGATGRPGGTRGAPGDAVLVPAVG
ncbi:hypothetical protein [Frankia sp. Cas3]|uniref:hypothetical protein n=1 Tax=Frankia sp. Cas3 TaxID=3073926 RepID=UPI002AD343A3|nr:hypothetical protein [Frankia sp. Cas3]